MADIPIRRARTRVLKVVKDQYADFVQPSLADEYMSSKIMKEWQISLIDALTVSKLPFGIYYVNDMAALVGVLGVMASKCTKRTTYSGIKNWIDVWDSKSGWVLEMPFPTWNPFFKAPIKEVLYEYWHKDIDIPIFRRIITFDGIERFQTSID